MTRRAPGTLGPALALLLAVLACSAPGCAWANRDNRPLWNAFEEHLVPEDDTLFVVALPLTVPGGLLAILLDTFLVHPAQVIDDAGGDAADVWDDMRWDERYYTEMAALPLRAIGTPLVFVGSFLGRSLFDIDPREDEDEQRARIEARDRERHASWLAWLTALGEGDEAELGRVPAPPWDAALDEAFRRARERATATGRLELYETARRYRVPPWTAEPWMGLTDPDPAVRFLELRRTDRGDAVPPALREALRNDMSALVAERARRLWP